MQFELDFIRSLQGFLAPLDGLMRAASMTGELPSYLLLLPFVTWCIDFRTGARITALFLVSAYLNTGIKDVAGLPRPYHLDASIGLSEADGNGFPSNHAQSATVIWGSLAVRLRRRWAWVAAACIASMVGVSRVYLGVHYPHDVIGGWMIGTALLIAYTRYEARLLAMVERLPWGRRLLIVATAPLLMVAANHAKDSADLNGALFGAGIGLVLMYRYAPFTGIGTNAQRAWRYPIGLLGIAGLYGGLRAVLPSEGEALYLLGRFIRFAAVGCWITLGAPWLFGRLRLTPDETNMADAAPAGD